ncbi:MAG: hypothetical protein PUD93_09340 [Lachnospiraceae bacterium]|nr:hypothetical protein [Lachnospiraceae bacterium]
MHLVSYLGYLLGVHGKQCAYLSVMKTMDQGISDIAVTVDESSNAVSGVAEDTTQSVNAISLIQEQTANNQIISRELEGKSGRFEKV